MRIKKNDLKKLTLVPLLFIVVVIFKVAIIVPSVNVQETVHENNGGESISNDNPITMTEIKSFIGINRQEDNALKADFSVAIVDSGVFPHEDFLVPYNRIIGWKDFVNNRSYPYDDNGHGTAVAGIIAAGNSGRKGEAGIAPFVNIVAVKVLDYEAKGSSNTIIEAIQWVIDNREIYNIKILNISIGNIGYGGANQEIINMCQRASESGIIVVTSAGNKYADREIDNGIIPSDDTIVVGSIKIGDNNYAELSDCSRGNQSAKGKKPDIFAPGERIMTLQSDTLYLGKKKYDNSQMPDYCEVSGTSFAAAIVSGVLSLMIYKHGDMEATELKEMMFRDAYRDVDSFSGEEYAIIHVKE